MVTTYLTANPSLEAPEAGAVAHMSLHLKPTMSKNHLTTAKATEQAGQPSYPDFSLRGTAVRLYWRPEQHAVQPASRPVTPPLITTTDSVKQFLAWARFFDWSQDSGPSEPLRQ